MLDRIGSKLILTAGLVSIGIIGVFSYFIITSQQRALTSQVEHSAHQLSETIKSGTRYDMLLNQRERVHRAIDTVGRQAGIEKVRIFNKEGVIIYARDGATIGTMVDKRAEACYACHAADRPLERISIPETTRVFEVAPGVRNLGIINPIYNEPSCWQASCHAHAADQTVLGVLDVTMSLAEVDRQMAASRARILSLTATAILGLGLIIWLVLQRLVVRPVGELVEATNAVARGDLTHKLTVRRDDELGQLAKAFNDMTERLATAQRQIFQSDKLASLGRLAAGVAHEINNPLTGVLTYGSFLLKRAPEGSELREDLETIVRETKRCREIVKSMLDFARQVPTKQIRVEVPAVIERAVRIVGNQLSLGQITVEREDRDELPPIRADQNQLVQVFINLLVNAADAMGEKGGKISIRTRRVEGVSGPFIEIEVADSGCGIPAEDQARIFDPFFTTKEHRGTGLGLAVVWGIVERHGGTIGVESEPGAGATFTIRLPVVEPASLLVAEDAAA